MNFASIWHCLILFEGLKNLSPFQCLSFYMSCLSFLPHPPLSYTLQVTDRRSVTSSLVWRQASSGKAPLSLTCPECRETKGHCGLSNWQLPPPRSPSLLSLSPIPLLCLDFFCSVWALPIVLWQWSALSAWINWTLNLKTILYTYQIIAENWNRLCMFYIKSISLLLI